MDTYSHIQTAKKAGNTRLNLSCNLKEFPVEIFELANTLEILDLSGNELSALPDDFARLKKLRILFCSDNRFTELPKVLGECRQLSMVGFKANQISSVPAQSLSKNLRWLILTDNQITQLPSEIGQCTQLQKLMLAGNQLQTLPEEMSACTQLELLRIAANRLGTLPAWLFKLPKLSWLAYAGNPYNKQSEAGAQTKNLIPDIHWHKLDMQHKLGEGASGVIHQASWKETHELQNVAVKLFKGGMTSDGLPQSEKTACVSAGDHPNLITVHGKVVGHPADSKGLIMALIDPVFKILANPPSLESCTRDIYAADKILTLNAALRIAHGIASATQQLHDRGITHGDLYAHNILHNNQGECFLGDFGAASFFPLEDRVALQQIEVRAFGCLLEELANHCEKTEKTEGTMQALKALQEKCTQPNSSARPLFNEILSVLKSLQENK